MSITINLNKNDAKKNAYKGINTAEFIEQVKLRPILYDPKLGHGNQGGKSIAWREIASNLMENKWPSFNSNERDAIVKELEMKWKSLRDYFRKYVKVVEEAKSGKRPMPKKYFYYDNLTFLGPYMSIFNRSLPISDDDNDQSNNAADMDISETFKTEQNEESTFVEEAYQVNISEANDTGYQFIQVPSTHVIGAESIERDSADKKIAAVLEELVNLQKEEKNDDPMGNKKFLLSLLPFMRKLPDDINLEVRLQLMSVLQTYTRK